MKIVAKTNYYGSKLVNALKKCKPSRGTVFKMAFKSLEVLQLVIKHFYKILTVIATIGGAYLFILYLLGL